MKNETRVEKVHMESAGERVREREPNVSECALRRAHRFNELAPIEQRIGIAVN